MSKTNRKITLIPGDGIGPEVAFATKKVIDATSVGIEWETVNAGLDVLENTGELVPDVVFKSLEKNMVCLKGPITTPVGKGFRSINVMLRKKYDLFSNIRPVKSINGIETRYKNVDLVIFRENTEDIYIGLEELVSPGHAVATKVITEKSSNRIVRSAFEYAVKNNRKKITIVHKANILKITDGLFLDCAKNIAKEFPQIAFEDVIIDNMCMQLVTVPEKFDVIVTMNLYGDIISDLCAGLIGGLGIVPGANIGDNMAIFEAVHGSAPDITGKNIANPTAMMLSGAMMLDYIDETEAAARLRHALYTVISEAKFTTADIGGKSTTEEFTNEIIRNLKSLK